MKAYFIGLVIMGGCLLYGCHTKQKKGENSSDYSADSQSIARQDSLPLPTDTHAASSVSTEGWTAKQIRDSIELFFGKEYDTLPPHLRKIRRNMASLWNTDDSVFLQLIIAEAPYVKAFKTYVFDSPLIRIGGGPYDRSPEESLCEDTTHFSMRVSPNVYPTNIERIEIAITNHTDLEGMGGESYFIEHFDGKAWKGVPQPNFFVDIGYPIFPNETRDDFSATLMPELKENPPGLYRVHKTVITGQGAGIVHYPLAATFYLSDNPEDYEEYTRFASRLHEPRPMAEFKGGREAMIRFFEQNLRYPESYKGTGTKVRLFYSFTIDSLGMLQNPVSLPENILYPRDTGKTYDEFRGEALRVLRLMPAWEPAVNRIHGPVSIDTGLFFYFNEEGKCGIE